ITNENNYYIFRSACSDKVLDVSGANIASGTNIQIWDFNGTSAQKWVLE
ncbi:RICIN domain-containing protein, partial [Candidatus Saccharibacteria bacterium]|nr:RICIN domain-containing protein [Candidatus Saccharibacteria bacterium]